MNAVSAYHANINYEEDKGWYVTENLDATKGKKKLSSNGTYVFMKTKQEIAEHQPSDLIPLHDGMVISFINYEILITLSPHNQKPSTYSNFPEGIASQLREESVLEKKVEEESFEPS